MSHTQKNNKTMYTDTDIIYYDGERVLQIKDLISDWEHIKAKRVIEELLEDEPLNEHAHFLMGYIYDHRYGEHKIALNHYYNAIQIAPKFYEAIMNFVRLLNESGQPKTALNYALKARGACSKFHESIELEIALSYEKLGDFQLANQVLDTLNNSCIDVDILESIETSKTRLLKKTEQINEPEQLTHKPWGMVYSSIC